MSLRSKLKAIHDQYSGIGDDENTMWDEIISMCMDEVKDAIKDFSLYGIDKRSIIKAINDIKERQ